MAEVAVDSGELKTGKNSLPSGKKEMKLSELKVTDLKNELESRGLDKTGVKAALVDRLRKAIESEGENPDEYVFEPSDSSSPVVKKNVKKESKDLNNGSKQESENEEEEEVEDDKQESRDAEVLQVSLDDKEDNIDTKEAEDEVEEPMDVTEPQDTTLKLDVSENSVTSVKENDSPDQTIAESAESADNSEKAAPQPLSTTSTPTKAKVIGKTPVRVLTKQAKASQGAKNIWITNLPLSTRAADLKSFFCKHGKVILVKIVTNAKQTTGEKKFYGYITLSASKEAAKAVQDLNNTELNGQIVKLELTTDQPNTLLKKAAKVVVRKVKAVGTAAKVSTIKAKEKALESKETKAEDDTEKEAKDDRSSVTRRDRERDHRPREHRDYPDYYPRGSFRRPFGFRGRGRGRGGFPFRERPPIEPFRRPFGRRPFFGGRMGYRPALKPSFMQFKMREERQRERMRERSIRESERRRAEDSFRQKLVERKQREEAYRLEREKVQLRIEREMLEREKAEYLKNEREKQRMERERIEREREKLRRQAQARDMPTKRPFAPSPVDREPMWEKDKRARHYENRYPSFSEKPPGSEGRPDFREAPPGYRKFEHRPDHYEREGYSPSTSRSDLNKYGKGRPEPPIRDHDERRVYKRPYFKEDAVRAYPPREVERYAPPPEDRGYKRKMHETMRSPRPRGGGGGRRMPYY